jgi:hypothetical protein
MSNYDAWYLDCGYGGWVGATNNWCSPYKGWQTFYDNSPRQIYGYVLFNKYESKSSTTNLSSCPHVSMKKCLAKICFFHASAVGILKDTDEKSRIRIRKSVIRIR